MNNRTICLLTDILKCDQIYLLFVYAKCQIASMIHVNTGDMLKN